MAFTTVLYNIDVEPYKLDKTPLPTSGSRRWANASTQFKEKEDFINPRLLIKGTANQINGKNYLTISAAPFDRYYFITKISAVTNELWEVECHEDVLMTYKTQIQSLSGILDRQSDMFNLYLNDPNLLKTSYPLIQHKAFPNHIEPTDYHYYLITAGG